MKIPYTLTALVLLAFSCTKSGNFTIKGTLTNSVGNSIYLEKLDVDSSVPFDSSKIDKEGHFKFTGDVHEPTFFLLKLKDRRFITLLVDSGEHVNLSADYINFSADYNIGGSLGSEKVYELNRRLIKTNASLDSLKSLVRLHQGAGSYDARREEWISKMDQIAREQQAYSNKFILDNPFSMASVLAIYQKFNNGNYVVQDLQTIKVAASALYSMYPNSKHAQTLYEDTKSIMKNVRNMKMKELIAEQGVNSPEVILPDPAGKKIALSSYRGKYVLLQFWSAFDADSRIMNPVLKENYKEFKSKGFEIYQVSIDTSRQVWMQTIEADQLNWCNVGDMDGSIQAITSYNIHTIPSNYLLDPEGRIIARDLKGPALHRKLSEILN